MEEKRDEPPLRPLHWRLFHWGPIVAMSIVGMIAITSIYCHLMWWPPFSSIYGLLDILLFLLWNYLCLSNFLQAAYIGPGYVPLGWRPDYMADEQYLQECEICEGFKVPRSHHCRQCSRCVMKMDHHCPWINNCCGHRNQGYFVGFLISAVFGCIHATIILGPSLYWAVFRVWYMYYGNGTEPRVELGLYGLFAVLFAFGLAAGVIIAVGFLFLVQMRGIMRNRTAIEDYIEAKARQREREPNDKFVWPYDLGWKANLKHVITWDLAPRSNGIYWPVKDGCNQYTLTIEQIEQKRLKRALAQKYEAQGDYDGTRIWPKAVGGWGAICSQPCMDQILPLKKGDQARITRWRRHWLYGEKIQLAAAPVENGRTVASGNRPKLERGWMPRKYLMEICDEEEVGEELEQLINGPLEHINDGNQALNQQGGNTAAQGHKKTE